MDKQLSHEKGREIAALLKDTQDLFIKSYHQGTLSMDLFYFTSLCDGEQITAKILNPFIEAKGSEHFIQSLIIHGAMPLDKADEAPDRLILGSAILVVGALILEFDMRKWLNSDPEEVRTENTVMGPQKSFNENINTNLNMIRSRYPSQHLQAEEHQVGKSSHTNISILFDSSLVKPEQLNMIRKQLKSIKVDMLQSCSQLSMLMNQKNYSLFPNTMVTERSDRVCLNLSQGKVIILVQGAPFAMVAPAVFFDFMSAMDDQYQSFWIAKFLLIMRYVALMITVALPALYVAIVSYNPEITRVQLTLSIAGSRAAVPYPSYVEVLVMLSMIEALIEASLRLPKYIGSTATTVGGLILGQAAQTAGLVSSIMIIITSAVAISNFVIPINAMSFSMRLVKYVIILFAAFFGITGIAVGFFLLVAYLTQLRSFGEPYLQLFGNTRGVHTVNETAGESG